MDSALPDLEDIRPAYVGTPRGRLHYLEAGMGTKAILLFHETPLSSKSFVRLMPLLAVHLRVIAFDTPGYGGSASLSGDPSIEGYADFIWDAVRQLGLTEVAVAGIHTGAAIAVELASNSRPGPWVVAAVLSGVPVFEAAGRAKLASFIERDSDPGEAAVVQTWQDRARRWVRASPELLIQALADELAVFARRNEGFKAVRDYDTRGAIARVAVPVLVLNGEQDSMAQIDIAAAPLFADAKLVLLPEWGGQLQWSAVETYGSHVLDFVQAKFSQEF
ncbi:MAG: alpha/beta hydrolase [Steroidobacteraceae bacterium]